MVNRLRVLCLATMLVCLTLAPASRGTTEESTPPESSPDRTALEALLPDSGDVPGCTCIAPPRFYNRGTLWDYINGGADTYLQYGFRLLLVSDWTAERDSTRLSAEVYRMESPNHAFGIYSAERFGDETPIDIGVESYRGAYFLNFWKGPYYVKLSAMRSSKAAEESMMELAAAVAESIRGDFAPPELFERFPEEDRVQRSERFVPNNFLGHAFLKNGHLADYESGDDSYRVFLADMESAEAAAKAFEEFTVFLSSGDRDVTRRRKSGYEMVAAGTGTATVVFRFRSYVGGVLGLEESARAQAVAETLANGLRSLTPNGNKK